MKWLVLALFLAACGDDDQPKPAFIIAPFTDDAAPPDLVREP